MSRKMIRDRRLGIFKPDLYECIPIDILCSDQKNILRGADDEVYDEEEWIYEEWIYYEELEEIPDEPTEEEEEYISEE